MNARVHSLKIAPEWFQAVMDGRKTFEIRRNDRDFLVGDVLHLEEYDAAAYGDGGGYTGRWVCRRVSFLTDYHQEHGFVVLGLIPWVPNT